MFKKVLEYAGKYRKITYLAVITLIISVVFSVIPYYFVYQIIDSLLSYQTLTFSYLINRLILIAGSLVLYGILYVLGLTLSHQSAYHTLKNLRISLQKKLEAKPLGTIENKGVGALKKMFIDDIDSIELILAHALPEGIANLMIPIIVYIAMFLVDWKLALLSLCSLPLGMFAMGAMFKIGMKEMNNYYAAALKMNNTIIEYINGMEVVKVFNRDGESYHRYEKGVMSYRDLTLAWYKLCYPYMALYSSLIPCVAIVTLPLGSYFVLCGYSTLSHLVLVLCMSFAIGAPLLKAMSFGGTLPQINYKVEALEKMMASAPLKQSQKGFQGKNYDIVFDDVCFAYEKDEVLHDINIKIKQGSTVAFIGESGSGKSTLAKLLVHFYDPTKGTIKIGTQNIQDMSIEALNQQISYVSQDQFLFNTSLKENIRIGNLNASDEEVKEAARKAQCNEFLDKLENGIETLAGDGGKQLSGGERQRISLARAILKDAPIIILDEATAFMDPENEDKMNQAISEVIKNKTVIVIAHRLQTIIHADQICVLNNGYLEATGKHEQLLQVSPSYQKLWQAALGSEKWKIAAKGEHI